jgi:probable HAF family extracellular repeat protein
MLSLRRSGFRRARRLLLTGAMVVAAIGVAMPVAATEPRPAQAAGQAVSAPVPVFVRDVAGRYTSFDVPFGPFAGEIIGINNNGQITGGYFFEPGGAVRGFLREADGRFSQIDVPGAADTQPFDINDLGQIVGTYEPADITPVQRRGFVRHPNGQITTINIDNAQSVQAAGINNQGQVVGQYLGRDQQIHGFRWQNGRSEDIDGPDLLGATVTDINENGEMVGLSPDADAGGVLRAFLLSQGDYTTIDSGTAAFTIPFGINNGGQIAGLLINEPVLSLNGRGFLAQGAGGPFTDVQFPGAVPGTAATDINDVGTVVGIYGNPDAASGPPSARTAPGAPQDLLRQTMSSP